MPPVSGNQRPAPGRMPGAASSLRVQLSVQELLEEQPRPPVNAAQALMADWRNRRKIATSSKTTLEPSDEQLLTESVLAQQKRKRTVLQKQELLISNNVNEEQLKRALTHLGPSSWTQVTHERHLAGSCGFPTCPNKPALPEISQRKSALPIDAPRYRISFSTRSLVRDTADDPGGRNAFCSDNCWRQAEWVRRWVLSDDLKGKGRSSDSGRFERKWTEDQWHEIELLSEIPLPGALNGEGGNEASQAAAQQLTGLPNGKHDKQGENSAAAMIDSLVIHERKPGEEPTSPSAARSAAANAPRKPIRSPHTKVRGGIGLQDLMGGEYLGKETSSELVRQIQSTSRQGHAQVAQVQREYAEASDEEETSEIEMTEEEARQEDEIARLMESALGIRDIQRDKGEMEEPLVELRAAWEKRKM